VFMRQRPPSYILYALVGVFCFKKRGSPVYVERNTVTLSCNHCCHGYAILSLPSIVDLHVAAININTFRDAQ
jgi:hypothetical protein